MTKSIYHQLLALIPLACLFHTGLSHRTRATRTSAPSSPTFSTPTPPLPSSSWPRGCRLWPAPSWTSSATPPPSWSSRKEMRRRRNPKTKTWERSEARKEQERGTKHEDYKRPYNVGTLTRRATTNDSFSECHNQIIYQIATKSQKKYNTLLKSILRSVSQYIYLVLIVWSNDFCVYNIKIILLLLLLLLLRPTNRKC